MIDPRRVQRTFRLDSARLAVDGITDTLVQTVFMLVAIQYFDLSDPLKSLIASASFIGFLGSLFYTSLLSKTHKSKSFLVFVPTIFGGLTLILASFAGTGPIYAFAVALYAIFLALRMPFFLGIYEENYPPNKRGKLLSWGLMLSILVAVGSNYIFGKVLDTDLQRYKYVFIFSGLLIAGSGFFLLNIPSSPPKIKDGGNPLRNLKVITEYPAFGYILAAWFILGFANLWSTPLRVVYLAEVDRGLGLGPLPVLIIMGIIPNVVKLPMTRVWAHLFDRKDFILVRMLMTACLGSGLLVFFLTRSIPVIILGNVLIYTGLAGTRIAWMLWVTRFSPPGKSQVFMSVHTFFTGVRGILGPIIGFLFVTRFPVRVMGFVSFGMALTSIVMLLPLYLKTRALGHDHVQTQVK